MGILVSVIIITKNQKEFLKQTIPLLLKQKIKGGFEIIVVDSGSDKETINFFESQPIRLIKVNPHNFNYARAFNKGAQSAKGAFLVRLSGDVVVTTFDFLNCLISPFKDSKVGATYGRYIVENKKNCLPAAWSSERFSNEYTSYAIKPYFLMGVNFINMIFNSHSQEEVFNLAGACCAIRKSVWEKRPFNERLPGAEDAEYAWFLHLIGYNIVYNPHAIVLHEHKKTDLSYWLKRIAWPIFFYYEIIKYWLLYLINKDPYENFRRYSGLQ